MKMKMTLEMSRYSEKRLSRHIFLVGKYLDKSTIYFLEHKPALMALKSTHDYSKTIEPERSPYVYISWMYHCKRKKIKYDIDDILHKRMDEATFHHVKSNKHHPEYYDDSVKLNLFLGKDRDNPDGDIVDATKMDDCSIIEMCCDWCAVSEELDMDPFVWADKQVNTRWKFTHEQETLIYKVLYFIW